MNVACYENESENKDEKKQIKFEVYKQLEKKPLKQIEGKR